MLRPGFSGSGASFPALTPCTLATERQRQELLEPRGGCLREEKPAIKEEDAE